jgi:hypothetical protein
MDEYLKELGFHPNQTKKSDDKEKWKWKAYKDFLTMLKRLWSLYLLA